MAILEGILLRGGLFVSIHRLPPWLPLSLAGLSLVLLPAAYMAGWLGDLGQVKPALAAISREQQMAQWHQAHEPQEPPVSAPEAQAQWTDALVTLSWPKVSGATSYTIYRAASDQPLSQASPLAKISNRSYTDTTVAAGSGYTYWVAADNSAGQSAVSRAVAVHTYLTWAAVLKIGEGDARMGNATAWSTSAWGLITRQSAPAPMPIWNLGGTLMTPDRMASPSSTWFTKRGIRWRLGAARLSPEASGGVLRFTGSVSIPDLPVGQATSENLALWRQGSHWTSAVVESTLAPLPPNALILNQNGQAVGMTNAAGTLHP